MRLSARAFRAYQQLTPEQRIGQLLMVALDTAAAPSSLNAVIANAHVGNMLFLGGWNGADRVRAASRAVAGRVSDQTTGGIKMLIAADQEGGDIQQLRGQGFTKIPSAVMQARMSPGQIRAAAASWGRELLSVGVNLNLAPVTDTVPAELGKQNQPIGRWNRQYGATPAAVTKGATAFIQGMADSAVMTTVKHFPGLGRVKNNTDFSAEGITDEVATVSDRYLQPFMDGVKAGAGLVMVGSARYPKLDSANTQAMFSRPILTDLLRQRLGFSGVVITDDINAAAVRSIFIGKRAVDYVAAGGDILLTAAATTAPALASALAQRRDASTQFAAQLEAAVARVLALKDRMGLLP